MVYEPPVTVEVFRPVLEKKETLPAPLKIPPSKADFLNPLEALVMQKRSMTTTLKREPDLIDQQKLLEKLLQHGEGQQRTYRNHNGPNDIIGGKVPVYPHNAPDSKRDQCMNDWWS